MFGEDISGESPRMPSPWRALSRSQPPSKSPSPSPLALTPSITPSTPRDRPTAPIPAPSVSLVAAELDGFEALSFDDDDDDDEDDELVVGVTEVLANESGDVLPAEVDKSGNIEYKLKLLTTSPLRLAKLVTQLKWRLVEGGGIAVYELGVLDDGTLVGLVEHEMLSSLETLGRMLSALGGGEIQIGRVVQLGGDPSPSPSSSDSGSDGDMDEKRSPTAPLSPPFSSFQVDAQDELSTLETLALETHSSFPSPLVTSTTTGTPTDILSTPIPIKSKAPHPERTPEERAILKRNKRDARRARRESEGAPPKVRGKGQGKGQGGNSQEGAKLSQSAPARTKYCPMKPLPASKESGEVRFVVEAIVTKKGYSGGGREEHVVGQADEELEEGHGEGWTYLDFDWMKGAGRRAS
ncbi:gtp binding protein 2 [Pseudohyphozyma bogoriensis]|nr:gtp binding protein 2 [Pseudohyphozyma bogoriensis]